MGGIGVCFEDIRGISTNPSSIGDIKSLQGYIFADQRFGIKELSSYSLAAAIQFGSGSFGVNVGRYGFDLYNENLVSLS